MTTKTSKKTTAAKKTTTKVQTVKTSELADGRTLGPSLADIVNGTSPAVAKAVAEKRAKVEAEKPAEPAKKSTKKSSKAEKKAPKAKEAKEPRATSGALIKQMILAGDDAETILAAVHKAFPDSAATKGDVSWNRWDLKRKGLLKG